MCNRHRFVFFFFVRIARNINYVGRVKYFKFKKCDAYDYHIGLMELILSRFCFQNFLRFPKRKFIFIVLRVINFAVFLSHPQGRSDPYPYAHQIISLLECGAQYYAAISAS